MPVSSRRCAFHRGGEQETDECRGPASVGLRHRKIDAALGSEYAEERFCLTRPWEEALGNQDRVPEHDLQQDGDVAQEVDVAGGEFGDEPVLGQRADADGDAEQRRQYDTDDRDLQSVEKADGEGTGVIRSR